MVPRYARPQMSALWEPEARYRIWFEIEAHATQKLADLGVVPASAAKALWDWWAGNPAIDVAAIDAKDGKLAGVRVTASRTGSLSAALGLATGDVIEAIDGQPIDSPQVLMKMYDRLADLRRVDLGVRRKNAAVTLTYDLP